ncbi:MAG: PEGA domain-containing protein [Myxococcales bacterium]|nr:PEGA domain-containing protein [Myxococcales bacterium]
MRLLGLFLALFLCAPVARADSIADEADFRFHRAANLYRQGKVEEALSEFLASNRLVRNRNVVYNIARSFEQLGKFNEAYRWYTEILGDEMPDADRKDLLDALKRLRPSLALLQVESTPNGATVYVDRVDLGARGQTPVTLALPPAKVKVMVELAGYRPFEQHVTLATGRTAVVQPALDRIYGAVAVEGEPSGSEIRVEDQALTLSGGRAKVVPGRHVLTISAPGHATDQITIDVPADGVAPVKFKLLPLPPPSGALVVRANLDGALVRVDGKEAGFTPGVIDNVVVGRHKVEILADGREPVVEQVNVQKNERSFVDARLRYAIPRVVAAEKELTQAQDAPASITVISAEEIRGFGYTTLAEALGSVRGMYTTYDRAYPTLGVRGFSSPGVYNSRVLVLSDGHVMNEASQGTSFIGHEFDTDLSDVERIEVVRGPGSVVYGSAAFFAVVNVVHRTPARGVHGEAGGTVGTLGEETGSASASVAGESAWAWARAGGVDRAGDPFFVAPGSGSIAQDLDKERAGHVDLRARAGDLTLSASYNERKKLLPTAAYETVFGGPGTFVHDRRGYLQAEFEHAFESGLAFDVRAAYDGVRYNGSWNYAGRPQGMLGSDSDAEDWGTAEARIRLPELGGHRIFVGGEFQARWKVDLNSIVPGTADGTIPATYFANYNDGTGLGSPDPLVPNAETVLSGYAGDDWRISRRVQLDAAFRVDQYIDNFPVGSTETQPNPAFNPRVALLLQPYDAGRTKLLFGRAFRYPGFYERYFNDGGISDVKPDSALKPEVVYSGEIEHAHQFNDEVSVTVAGYLSEMRDLIRIGSPAGSPDISQYQNRQFPVHAAGGEIEVRWQAGPGWVFSGWYAYSVVRDDNGGAWFSGSPLANSPSSTGALRALYPLVPQTLSLSTELTYGGPRRSIADPGYAPAVVGEELMWNLGISGEYARYGVRYGAFIYNLLDQRVTLPAGPEIAFPNHAVPQYGRTLRLQLAASF